MAKITNLNRFRKDKARAARKTRADANAVKFGRTRAQKAAAKAEALRIAQALDGARRKE